MAVHRPRLETEVEKYSTESLGCSQSAKCSPDGAKLTGTKFPIVISTALLQITCLKSDNKNIKYLKSTGVDMDIVRMQIYALLIFPLVLDRFSMKMNPFGNK